MMSARISAKRLLWPGTVILALLLGIFLGGFIEYARGTDHQISSSPVKVDYCFLFSHEDLFRGQLVETEAQYTQVIEGGSIGKDECPEFDSPYFGPIEKNSVLTAWETDLFKDWYNAKFELSFVGVIPSYPRYKYWIADAKNRWHPMHHVPFIRLVRITHFERIQ
jgi:hypothetical protein